MFAPPPTHLRFFNLPALSSHIYSSPRYDRAVFLRLHVVVEVRVHFLFSATMASADMVGRRKDVPAPTSEVVVPLVLLLCAFVCVKLSPPGIIHFMTQEDIARGRRVWKVTVMVLADLFHQRPGSVAPFPVCVDGPVVVCARPVLSGSDKEQPSFIAIVATVTASTAGRYGLPAAGVTEPLLPSTPAQENANERDDQKQGQERANHSSCYHTSTEWLFQGFCRGGGMKEIGGGKEQKRQELRTICEEVLLSFEKGTVRDRLVLQSVLW